MTRTRDVPLAATRLRTCEDSAASVTLAVGEGPRRPGFNATVHSGAILNHWFWGQFAIDLAGMHIPGKSIPVLLDHDTEQRVGWTTQIEVKDHQLLVAGELMEVNEAGKQVLAEARAGFPWQMSMAIPPRIIEEVLAGATADVNGKTMHGPGVIFRESDLREVTFTALGADKDTSASVLGQSAHETLKVEVISTVEREPSVGTKGADMAEKTEPAAPAVDVAKLRADIETAERKRLSAIMKLSVPGQEDLRDECISSGMSEGDAAIKLLEHAKANAHLLYDKAAHLNALRSSSAQSTGAVAPAAAAPKTPEEEWIRMSQKDRADYAMDFETFKWHRKKENDLAAAEAEGVSRGS